MTNATTTIPRERLETLGPAEHIIQTLTQVVDHLYHGRPGIVTPDQRTHVGVRWEPCIWKLEGTDKIVYRQEKAKQIRLGVLGTDNKVTDGTRVIGEYRSPGIFPEVATYLYGKIAEIWKLDNDFMAHFASWAYAQDYRDLKVLLAAFMLVQSRSGQPVMDGGKIAFDDDDHRAIGEAMCLLYGKTDMSPKMLLRVREILQVPGVAQINRDCNFGKSDRNPIMGRYPKTVEKWLKHREQNPRILAGLVKAGFRTTVMDLSRKVGYKPETPKFFEILRWKQVQAKDGRREIAIGVEVTKAETWEGMTEREICERISTEKPNYKRLTGMLPANLGLTAAIMAAAIEAGSLSDTDLCILSPTIEDLGLLSVPAIQTRWATAVSKAENQRSANIARNVKKAETVEVLQAAADTAMTKAMEEVTRGLEVFVCVDISGSMNQAIEQAKEYLKKMLGGFPLEKLHVSVFNQIGHEVVLKASSAVAVEHAFSAFRASGGTIYAAGVRALEQYKPAEGTDLLILFVGDEADHDYDHDGLLGVCRRLDPVAFGLLKVPGEIGTCVQDTAVRLGVPCFMFEPAMFEDPYSVTRTLRNLIASTPVGKTTRATQAVHRQSLVEAILACPILKRPVWA